MFDLERMIHDKSSRVVAAQRAQQQVCDKQRDVYESHRHRIFALAFYMTGSEIEAEEILTITFVDAFRAASEPQGAQVDKALVDRLRARFPLENVASLIDLKSVAGGADLSGRNVRRTDLEEAIQELAPAERLLFLLRDVEGYASSAISQLLDMPEATVQRGLLAARIRLRQALAALPEQKQAA